MGVGAEEIYWEPSVEMQSDGALIIKLCIKHSENAGTNKIYFAKDCRVQSNSFASHDDNKKLRIAVIITNEALLVFRRRDLCDARPEPEMSSSFQMKCTLRRTPRAN